MNLRKLVILLIASLSFNLTIGAFAADFQQVRIKGPKDADNQYSGVTYGPINASDTLWAIASKYQSNSNASIYQVMEAIYELNPDSFERKNINLLIEGTMLRLPSQRYISRVNEKQAFDKAALDNQMLQTGAQGQTLDRNGATSVDKLASKTDLDETKQILEQKLGAIDEEQNRQFQVIRQQFAESIVGVQSILTENQKVFERLDSVNTDLESMRSQEVLREQQMALMGQSIDELLNKSRQEEKAALLAKQNSTFAWLSNPLTLIIGSILFTLLFLGGFAYWLINRKPASEMDLELLANKDEPEDTHVATEMDDLSDALSEELGDEFDEQHLFDNDEAQDDVLAEELQESLDDALDEFDDLGDDMLVPDSDDAAEDLDFQEGSDVIDQDDLDNLFGDEDDLLAQIDDEMDNVDLSSAEEVQGEPDTEKAEDELPPTDSPAVSVEPKEEAEEPIAKVDDQEGQPEISIDDLLVEPPTELPDGSDINSSDPVNEDMLQQLDKEITSQSEELDNITSTLIDELEQVESMQDMLPDEEPPETFSTETQHGIQQLDKITEDLGDIFIENEDTDDTGDDFADNEIVDDLIADSDQDASTGGTPQASTAPLDDEDLPQEHPAADEQPTSTDQDNTEAAVSPGPVAEDVSEPTASEAEIEPELDSSNVAKETAAAAPSPGGSVAQEIDETAQTDPLASDSADAEKQDNPPTKQGAASEDELPQVEVKDAGEQQPVDQGGLESDTQTTAAQQDEISETQAPAADDEVDTLPEDVAADEVDTLPEDVAADEVDTLPEDVAADEVDTLPEALAADEVDNLPEAVAADEVDTLPEDVAADEVDTLPEDVAADEVDTLPEAVAADEVDTLPEDVAADEVDTLPEAVAADEVDTLPEAVAADEVDTLPEAVAADEVDTLPEAVAADEVDTLPEAVAADEVDTLPEAVAADDADNLPEDVAADDADNLPEESAADDVDTLPEESAADDVDTLPEAVAVDEVDTLPEAVAVDEVDTLPEDVAADEVDTLPEELAAPASPMPDAEVNNTEDELHKQAEPDALTDTSEPISTEPTATEATQENDVSGLDEQEHLANQTDMATEVEALVDGAQSQDQVKNEADSETQGDEADTDAQLDSDLASEAQGEKADTADQADDLDNEEQPDSALAGDAQGEKADTADQTDDLDTEEQPDSALAGDAQGEEADTADQADDLDTEEQPDSALAGDAQGEEADNADQDDDLDTEEQPDSELASESPVEEADTDEKADSALASETQAEEADIDEKADSALANEAQAEEADSPLAGETHTDDVDVQDHSDNEPPDEVLSPKQDDSESIELEPADEIEADNQLDMALDDFAKEEPSETQGELEQNDKSVPVESERSTATSPDLDDIGSFTDFDDDELEKALQGFEQDEEPDEPSTPSELPGQNHELDDVPGLGDWLNEADEDDDELLAELENASFDDLLKNIDEADDDEDTQDEHDSAVDIESLLSDKDSNGNAANADEDDGDFLDVDTLLNERFDSEANPLSDKDLDLNIAFGKHSGITDDADTVDVDSDSGFGAKLDLSHAYIEIGEIESAKELLTEIIENGAPPHSEEAQLALDKL